MIPRLFILVMLSAVFFPLFSCKGKHSPIPKTNTQVFNGYWFKGQAEISHYALSQARYGDTHDGETVLVFVTEDFSKSKQVKMDEPQKYKSDAVKVLKLNTNKEFITGIYKYTMMSSVFMPLDHAEAPHSLKLTASVHDWCGQTFMQANWKGNRYEIQQFSYFEKDGDKKFALPRGWLEDEVWTLIRVAPETLPLGEVKMIASAFYLRLTHTENKVYNAITALVKKEDHYTYSITYSDIKRKLEIDFETTFPYKILGWTETYGDNEITTGKLLKTMMSDYWLHNQAQDEPLRDSLNLGH